MFSLDGRWSQQTAVNKIHDRVLELRNVRGSKYTKQLFVGYTIMQSGYFDPPLVPMSDCAPPEWALKK